MDYDPEAQLVYTNDTVRSRAAWWLHNAFSDLFRECQRCLEMLIAERIHRHSHQSHRSHWILRHNAQQKQGIGRCGPCTQSAVLSSDYSRYRLRILDQCVRERPGAFMARCVLCRVWMHKKLHNYKKHKSGLRNEIKI
uniref:ARAD1B20108p n=1 Tax=Blastobotrys adeninivorans TaxID=409370 RepID=A0A060T6M6_BLAAD